MDVTSPPAVAPATAPRHPRRWFARIAVLVALACVAALAPTAPALGGPVTPEAVRRLTAEPASGTVTLRWRPPVDAGAHAITGYRIAYRALITPHARDTAGPGAARVFGGTPIELRQAPWQVALLRTGVGGINAQFCGGSVIHPRWVLTAAHCVTNRRGPTPVRQLQVGDGITDLDQVRPEQRIDVARIVVHPRWFTAGVRNQVDLALVELVRPVQGSTPIALDRARLIPADTEGWVSGWGSISADLGGGRQPVYPTLLHGASVRVLAGPGDACGNYRTYNEAEHVCAAEPGVVDTCSGDSGGPLALVRRDRWVLSGVTSFGVGCGRPAFPGIYARVSSHVRWVTRHVPDLRWQQGRVPGRARCAQVTGLVDGVAYGFVVAPRTPRGLGAPAWIVATPG